MYQTSDQYKERIYADNTRHLLNLYIEGEQVNPDYILDFKVSHVLFSDGKFSLGSVTAKCVEFRIYKDALPNAYHNIEKHDDYTVTIKAIDHMIKFEFNYDGSQLTYPCMMLTILRDICLKAGVELRFYFFFKC